MRERTGSIFKRKAKTKGGPVTWWARITYTDPLTGKRRDLQRRAKSRSDAIDIRDRLVAEYDETQGRSLDRTRLMFSELCDYFEQHYLKPAVYVEGRKVAGARSIKSVLSTLKALRAHFGSRPLKSITYEDLREYRALRLKTPVLNGHCIGQYLINVSLAAEGETSIRVELENLGIDVRKAAADRVVAFKQLHQAVERLGEKVAQIESFARVISKQKSNGRWTQVKESKILAVCHDLNSSQRSIASVNRELSKLRRLLNIAHREGWITRNPFNSSYRGEPLISVADERKRERILSREEERRLLAACGETRAHLRALIVAAIDTGCRLGELLKLHWKDVSIEESVITIQAFNTKTMRERQVSITIRLKQELERLWSTSTKQNEQLVFGIRNNVKRSWTTVRRTAGLDDVRFHDLRHTHGSRLDECGFSLAQIGSQLGHSQVQTTLRYVNRNREGVTKVGAALNLFNTDSETDRAD